MALPFDGHANFAKSLVATAPSPAASGLTFVVTAADGAKFPAVPFNVVIWPTGVQPTTTNAEIGRCGTVATDTLTITRAQEGTSARTVIVGDQIAASVTARTLTDIEGMAVTEMSPATSITIPNRSNAVMTGNLLLAAGVNYALQGDSILRIL